MSLKTLLIDQSDSIGGATAKTATATGGTIWALSGWDGAQVAGWVTAIYVLFQLYVLMPKIIARVKDDWRKLWKRDK